jgi:DNA-binding transcriptional LysR family regulator
MPSTALELRHLETLLALAECGSLSKAAARLFLTQSALSHQLKALEQHFGAALVEKSVRPLRFTAIGQRLLDLARTVLPQVAEAGRDVARLAQGHAGPLRVAVQCHNCFDWLMPAMDAYRTLWPEVELDIISGFVVDPLPLIPAGIDPKRRTAELTVAILQLVASGRGVAALPSWTVGNYIERGYVVSRPIGRDGLRCELYAATTRSGAEAAYIREFITLTRTLSLTELRGVSAL